MLYYGLYVRETKAFLAVFSEGGVQLMMLQWLTNFTGLHLCLNICGQPRSLQERSHVRSHSMPATNELNISP